MKVYITADSTTNSLREAQRQYNARKARYDERMKLYDRSLEAWRAAYDEWEEAVKTNPDLPRPDPQVIQEVKVAPWCDPDYSMDEARKELTAQVLNTIAGKDMVVRFRDGRWVMVLSVSTPRKYTYYRCATWWECSWGSYSGQIDKYTIDELSRCTLDIPIEVLTLEEFAEHIAKRFHFSIEGIWSDIQQQLGREGL